MKKIALAAAVAAVVLAPQFSFAESDVRTNAAAGASVSGRLDFRVVIPSVLFFQVGAGTLNTDDTTVTRLTFTVPGANVADGTDVAATGGDAAADAVNVRLFSNAGNVNLSAVSTTDLTTGGVTIPWSEFTVATAAGAGGSGFTAAAIAHPAIDGGTTTVAATSGVIRQHGTWQYTYGNGTPYQAGTYNGMVTYTAALP